ncbi:helix-turn-helix domain-containing protein [Tissierella sp. MSJ-40]|uniref:Helix-turn-helix domain-containing protein n=1 Tax=Tissierella simiarum TaxID=2841534 RepID=A0ABS6E980_9FIRM|nr:transposase [Tissierella simiarum]MBU5439485.1 helix-turn-helix domain-containing protein [Tissierella simiarum]
MKKKKGGRLSKYESEWKDKLIVIEGWARDGLTDEQIAKNMGISPSTLYEWKKKYSEFSEALKRGKDVIDREVENALLKRALGYGYEEVTKERMIKKDVKGDPMTDLHGFPISEMVTTKIVTKQVVPDTTAQIFWLKNRKPEQWRDKQEVTHSGSVDAGLEKLNSILNQVKRNDGS